MPAGAGPSTLVDLLAGQRALTDDVRTIRRDAIDGVQECYRALFDVDDGELAHVERLQLGRRVAVATGDSMLASWFDDCLADCQDVELVTATDRAGGAHVTSLLERMATSPGEVTRGDVLSVSDEVGVPTTILLTQIVSFLAFLGRVVATLDGREPAAPVLPEQVIITGPVYDLAARRWQPRLEPVHIEHATAGQIRALELSGKLAHQSPYFRVLAHHPASLIARSKLYDLVMYAEGGAPHEERELAALVVSMINGCRYCASIHSRRLRTLCGSRERVEQVLRGEPLDDRWTVVRGLATAVTASGSAAAAAAAAARLRGMEEAEIFDITMTAAMFGWANRLMQGLGDSEEAV